MHRDRRPIAPRPELQVELTDCAEVGDAGPCLAPAVLHRQPPMASTSGPIEFVATRCLHGHVLRMPASMLVGAG